MSGGLWATKPIPQLQRGMKGALGDVLPEGAMARRAPEALSDPTARDSGIFYQSETARRSESCRRKPGWSRNGTSVRRRATDVEQLGARDSIGDACQGS
jgi:hypothetical protein